MINNQETPGMGHVTNLPATADISATLIPSEFQQLINQVHT